MPVVSKTLSSIDETITKPVILQAIRSFAMRTRLTKFAQINYIDYTGNNQTVEINEDGSNVRLNTKTRFEVTSTEVPMTEQINTNTVNLKQGSRIIFEDSDIGVRVVVGRIKHKITLNCTYSASSKAALQSYTDEFLTDLSAGGYSNTFDAAMELVMSNDTVVLLHHLFKTKLATGQEQDTNFVKYLDKCTDHTFRLKSDINGTDFSFVFTEIARGMLIVAPVEPLEVTNEGNRYTTTVPLEFVFDRPTVMITRYPIFIGNQEIDKAFFNKTYNVNELKRKDSTLQRKSVMSSLLCINKQRESSDVRNLCYISPGYDEVVVNLKDYSQTPIFQQRFFYAPNDTRLICNLKSLFVRDDVKFQEHMFEYLVKNRKLAFHIGMLFINLMVTNNGKVLDVDDYYIDDNLDIRATYDLKPLGSYHILIVTESAPADMLETTFPTIKEYPQLVNGVIQHLFPYTPIEWYPVGNPPSNKFPNGSVNKGELADLLQKLPRTRPAGTGMMVTANAVVTMVK